MGFSVVLGGLNEDLSKTFDGDHCILVGIEAFWDDFVRMTGRPLDDEAVPRPTRRLAPEMMVSVELAVPETFALVRALLEECVPVNDQAGVPAPTQYALQRSCR